MNLKTQCHCALLHYLICKKCFNTMYSLPDLDTLYSLSQSNSDLVYFSFFLDCTVTMGLFITAIIRVNQQTFYFLFGTLENIHWETFSVHVILPCTLCQNILISIRVETTPLQNHTTLKHLLFGPSTSRTEVTLSG